MALVLASSSPRRQELLSQVLLGQPQQAFEIVCPDIDETAHQSEAPEAYVVRLAVEKAQAGLQLLTTDDAPVVIGSDTVVVADGQLLGKPESVTAAKDCLQMLAGKTHQVYTAVAAVQGTHLAHVLVCTQVTFCELTEAQIAAYVATGEPMDKAGAYGIQGIGGSFVRQIQGSYSGVVGLPLVETRELLSKFNF